MKPECRICGRRVAYFGDLCGECEQDAFAAGEDPFYDGVTDLERQDRHAIQDRMAADDY